MEEFSILFEVYNLIYDLLDNTLFFVPSFVNKVHKDVLS